MSEQQAFDGPSARHPSAEEPRWEHFGVVDDEQIAAFEKVRKGRDRRVRQLPSRPVEDQQPRLVALGGGRLGDEMRRKVIVEIRQIHNKSEFRSQNAEARTEGACSKPSDRNLPALESGRKRAISCVQARVKRFGRGRREAIRKRHILERSESGYATGHVNVGAMKVDPEDGHERDQIDTRRVAVATAVLQDLRQVHD